MKKIFTAWSGHSPLLVSIISPGKAEIFFDKKNEGDVMENLPTGVKLDNLYSISEKDVQRRARAYLQAHFRLLKEATLKGLTAPQRLQMLELALKLVPNNPPNKVMWKDKEFYLKKLLTSLRELESPNNKEQQIPPVEEAVGAVGVEAAKVQGLHHHSQMEGVEEK
jgi:DNA topoisomerase VI subunit B